MSGGKVRPTRRQLNIWLDQLDAEIQKQRDISTSYARLHGDANNLVSAYHNGHVIAMRRVRRRLRAYLNTPRARKENADR